MVEDWFVYLIFFGGGLVHSALGFGFPLFTTPLISMFYDVRYAILLTVIPTVFNNFASIVSGGSFIELLKRFYLLAFSGILGSFLGTFLIIFFPAEPFKIVLSLSIVVYLYSRYRKIDLPFIKEDTLNMLTFGFLGGVVGGTVNVSLAVYVVFLLNLNLSKEQTIKVINYCFILGKVTQIIVFAINEYYDYLLLEKICIASIAVLPGMAVGYQLRKRVADQTFRRILYLVLVITGTVVGYQGILFYLP